MDGVIGVLCLGVAVGTWWWIAKGMKQRGRGWLTRNLVGSFAGCFMAIFVVGLSISAGIIDSKSPEPAAVAVKTLRITPSVYAERINPLLEKFEKPYRVDPADITKGEVQDILKANLGPHASLVAAISKDTGELVDVTLIGIGDGKPMSGLEIMMIGAAALAAAAPDADYREVFKSLPQLVKGGSQTYGQVKLSVKPTDSMGTWFMAAPI